MYVGAAQPKAGTILVPVTTIDKFCDERKIQEVDIIKVDAEGNDIAGLLIYCMCLYMYVCMYVMFIYDEYVCMYLCMHCKCLYILMHICIR